MYVTAKQATRFAALLAALALLFGVFALPAFAEAEPSAAAAPTPTPTAAVAQTSLTAALGTESAAYNAVTGLAFTVNATTSGASVQNVTATLELPTGLALAPGEQATKAVGSGTVTSAGSPVSFKVTVEPGFYGDSASLNLTMTGTDENGLAVTATNTLMLTVTGAPEGPVADGEPSPTAEPTAVPTGSGVYVQAVTVTDIAGGEVSTVNWDDHVNIVLRVVDHASARNHVTADEIVARINSSVFQYTGVGEISQLFEESDAEGAYYSYVLLFRDVVYKGGGDSLPIDLSYLDTSMQLQQFSVTIGQCVDKDPNDPADAKSPGLVVRASSYGNSIITAGTPFTLSLTVYATSGTEDVNDVIASVTLPKGVTLTGGSLSTYIGAMSAASTRDVSYPILPAASFVDGVADITVSLTGTGAVSGSAVSGSCVISVPILQPDRFELGELQAPDTLTVGEMNSVSLSFINKGKNPISNLEAKLTGTNLGDNDQSQYVGNINAGTENSVDFDLTPTEAGPYSGTIVLSYEGQDGTIQSVSESFSGTVEEMPVMDMGMMDDTMAEPQPTGPSPVLIGILAAVAVAVVVIIVLVVRRKKKKAAELSQLEDEDDLGDAPIPVNQTAGSTAPEGNTTHEDH